jgi:anti-anti-sigma factor
MDTHVTMEQGAYLVRLDGEMAGGQQDFVARVTELIARRGAKIIVDLSGVPFLNSAAISELVHVVAQSNVQECRVVLAAPTPFVAGVLQTTQLDRFFELAETVADAQNRLK